MYFVILIESTHRNYDVIIFKWKKYSKTPQSTICGFMVKWVVQPGPGREFQNCVQWWLFPRWHRIGMCVIWFREYIICKDFACTGCTGSGLILHFIEEQHHLTFKALILLSIYFRDFEIISPWKWAWPFIWTNWYPFHRRMPWAKFGCNKPSSFGEEKF